ncbi:uncharacterized protein LOC124789278 isoform X2 [Schistocerca piceifrons]|uniref:uncharacterized protein LOC124789278 isoform X2 n=1 Tax=Schistocerca piceifrons TaxID=274613 RepID=UPI001F5FC23C|nr:uncharacterized protein LOC124789278 isoform X2 [Schistocerca piceifrons]
MRCILIFDQLSDILYTKYDRKFFKHLKKLATQQGLIREGKDEDEISPNIIIQIFSPIVASQRIMGCQFGNSYTSIQCQDGTNMVFDEYMGYLFVHIGLKSVTWLKRMLGICITVVKHLCGPDVSILKSNKNRAALLSRLLDTWTLLQDTDQAVLVEAVEQLMVNVDLSSATLRTLQEATEKLKTCPDFSKLHTMILVENKFLSLYSSRNAQDLSPHDIIFLSLLCEAHYMMPSGTRPSEANESDSSEEFYSPAGSPRDSPHHIKKQLATSLTVSVDMFDGSCEQDVLNTQLVLLTGGCSVYTPHIVHITSVEDGVYLLFIIEIWSMVDFSRAHLQEGHLAIMWKDTTFNYAYFLWFEDASGAPLKPKSFQPSALKSLPVPGVLCGDFYKNLMELSFPKTSPSKIRCFELYCIHLGLATSSCVLEHSRRLAATIWEVTGLPNNPLDIL